MEMKKPAFYKRAIAYVIDLLVVTVLAGLLSIILTDNTKYDEDSQKLLDLANQYKAGEIVKKVATFSKNKI